MANKLSWLVLPLLLMIFVILFWHKCEKEPIINDVPTEIKASKQSIDSIDKIVSKQKERLLKEDSVIIKYRIKYVDRYIEIIKESPDTCHTYINELYRLSNVNDSIMGNHILRQDSVINGLDSEILHYRFIVKYDSVYRRDSVPFFIKKAKRKGFWNGFKWGFGTGVAVDEGLRTGVKVLVKH